MSFRSIIIENPARISMKNKQLVIQTDDTYTLPVEDLAAILLESRQSVITVAALSFLGQRGCAVYICDEKHLPCSVLTPYYQHSRTTDVIRTQFDASEPLKKRLWQAIVIAKIRNQAHCLRFVDANDTADALDSMAAHVRSGDPDNLEATAARRYFPALFGSSFLRSSESGCNAALNYGYAILRGSIARHIASYGFLPVLGLHHRSSLNAFNLADDLIEPFRPVVDLLVRSLEEPDAPLTREKKQKLFGVLQLDITSGNQQHSVDYAIERLVQSLSRSLSDKSVQLTLPQLSPLRQHTYE